jgi:FkbM family methyltransferase
MNREHVLTQLLLRAWPFPRGAGRLVDRMFSNLSIKQQLATIGTTDGFAMTVNPNDFIGRHLYLTGEFDRSIVELLKDFAEPGDTLLDIGANIGYVSACFLKLVPDSQVVAVEPQRDVLELLTLNLAPFGRHKIYPYAISDKDGIGHFAVSAENAGAGRLVSSAGDNTLSLEIRSAESLFRDTGLSKIDLVKIDAEGSEAEIVRSCLPHFDRLKPRCVLFEDNSGQMQAGGLLRKMFESLNYRVFGVRKSLTRLFLEETTDRSFVAHDYVAVSPNRSVRRSTREKYRL